MFRHANLAGSSKHGGVLALMGDDHTAESSTNAHATEFLFVDTMIPILNPAGVQELIDYGLYGYRAVALRRHLGGDQMRQGQHRIDGVGRRVARPAEHRHAGIRHAARRPQHPPRDRLQLGQEARLHEYKRAAAAAFIRANGLNRIVYSGGSKPKIGIITVGKSYLDVRQALDDLGIDEATGQPRSASGCSRSAARGRSTSSTSRISRAASR